MNAKKIYKFDCDKIDHYDDPKNHSQEVNQLFNKLWTQENFKCILQQKRISIL